MENKPLLIVGGLVVFVFIIVAIGGSGGGTSSGVSSSSQPSICDDINSLKNQAVTVDYKELEKDPGSFSGQDAKFTGQVLQIQESGGYGVMRLAVTKESYGWNAGDVVYVEYVNHTDAVEGDIVTVYGQLTGSETYKSQANFEITIPSMIACSIEQGSGTAQTSGGVENNSQNTTATQATRQPTTPAVTTPTQAQNTPPVSTETVSQQNAVRKAKSYLDYTAFSHDGLIAQLEYDQFSPADALYGADYSGADWNEQAAAKAKSYMEYSAFSRGSLIAQLEYDKFTEAQAEYGANAVGL